MFDINVVYQSSFFGDMEDIYPTPENISKLLLVFKDMELLPNIFNEFIITQPGPPQARIELKSQNNEWSIKIATHRIDIFKNPTGPRGENLGSIEEFSEHILEICDRLLGTFPRKGNRISLITSSFIKEMSDDKLTQIYLNLCTPPDFYKKNPPYEWKYRMVSATMDHINEKEELINIITDINRVQGQMMQSNIPQNFDRILVGFDINTHQENKEARFDLSCLKEFNNNAIHHRAELLEELKDYIYA